MILDLACNVEVEKAIVILSGWVYWPLIRRYVQAHCLSINVLIELTHFLDSLKVLHTQLLSFKVE